MQRASQLRDLIVVAAALALAIFSCKPTEEASKRGVSSGGAPATVNQNPQQGVLPSTIPGNSTPTPSGGMIPTVAPGGSSITTPSGTKTKISFRGSLGDQVPGYIWIPLKGTGRMPAVLLMYGLGGSKDDGGVNAAAQKLNENAMVAITLDWPGTGERGSMPNEQRILGQAFDQTINDYRAAIDYLASRPEVDMQRLGYVGASWGAITGAAYVSRDTRIKAMVALVPVPNPLLGTNSPDARIAAIPPRPLLCIYDQNGGDFSDTICNAGRSPTSTIVGLATDHEMNSVRDQVYEMSKNFLVQHLK